MAIKTTVTFTPDALTVLGFGRYVDGNVELIGAIPPVSSAMPSLPDNKWPTISASDFDFDAHAEIESMGTFTLHIDAFDERLYAFLVADPHAAIASPTRWHTRQKRATCLRLKARDA